MPEGKELTHPLQHLVLTQNHPACLAEFLPMSRRCNRGREGRRNAKESRHAGMNANGHNKDRRGWRNGELNED